MRLVWRTDGLSADEADQIVAGLRERGVDAELDEGMGAVDPETVILLLSNAATLASALADLLPKLRRGAEVDTSAGDVRAKADLPQGKLRVIRGDRVVELEGYTPAELEDILAGMPAV